MFATDGFRADELRQGDLIVNDDKVRACLAQAHQYYAQADSYTHFTVITQSCDLVRRKGKFKADYITIAAARPFKLLVDRLARQHAFSSVDGILDIDRKEGLRMQIERMLNHDEKGFFLLPAWSHPSISEDLVVFLPLSVALKPIHYDTLLSAKRAQLDDIFSVKLGSLVGHLYARVATPGLEELGFGANKTAMISDTVKDAGKWVSKTRWELANRLAAERKVPVGEVIDDIPDEMKILANRIAEILEKANLLQPGDEGALLRKKVVNMISNDGSVRSIAKSYR